MPVMGLALCHTDNVEDVEENVKFLLSRSLQINKREELKFMATFLPTHTTL